VTGLDPAVERAILRCLQREPSERPASALAVAASLPGGDPLAAALAAGETPSPEMVADAGGEGGLHPALAVGLLVFCLVGLVVVAMLTGRETWLSRAPMAKPASVLADRAQQIIADLGYPDAPADREFGLWHPGRDHAEHLRESATSPEEWDRALGERPTPLRFWYRQSPRPLVSWAENGRVFFTNPPLRISGMTNLILDAEGRLLTFFRIPPQKDDSAGPGPAVDWSTAFAAAGLSFEEFSEVAPTWLPEAYCEDRVAWEGTYPDQEQPTVTVVACSYRGRPVYFDVIHPWDQPWRMQVYEPEPATRIAAVFSVLMVLSIIVGAAYLARRNLRMGRGDKRGALRLSLFVFSIVLIHRLLRADHVPDVGDEFNLIMRQLQEGVLVAFLFWLVYLAIEPLVRRHWPQLLVSWNRLLAGRFRDPLVGSRLLIGVAVGVLLHSVYRLEGALAQWLELESAEPVWVSNVSHAARDIAAKLIDLIMAGLAPVVVVLFFLVLFRVLFRRRWLAVAGVVLMFGLMGSLGSESMVLAIVFGLLEVGLAVFCLVRFGFLAGAAAYLTGNLLSQFPLPAHLSAWYAQPSWIALALLGALLLFAFHASLGGRALLKPETLDS
jgi:serine/threonine-protein kinase